MTSQEPPQWMNPPTPRKARMWRADLAAARQRAQGMDAVRPVCPRDARAMAALSHQAFLGGPDEATQDVLRKKVSAILAGGYGPFIAAASFVHESPAGMIDAAILVTQLAAYGAPVVALIAVGKPLQRRGLGTRLLERSLAALQPLGHTACCARITHGNRASERLFQACGFAPASGWQINA